MKTKPVFKFIIMGKSVCCQSETKIGYYNATERPDIHGVISNADKVAFGVLGTYCLKCGKLCDYISEGKEYYTNGLLKTVQNGIPSHREPL
jgi:hypothetical protein